MDDEYKKNPYRDRGDEALEHAEVNAPLARDDIEIRFKNDAFNGEAVQVNTNRRFTGLTKEELMKYANDPFWIWLRRILLVLFWVAWLGILAGAVGIVVFHKGTPTELKNQDTTAVETSTLSLTSPFTYPNGTAGNPVLGADNGITVSSPLNVSSPGSRSRRSLYLKN